MALRVDPLSGGLTYHLDARLRSHRSDAVRYQGIDRHLRPIVSPPRFWSHALIAVDPIDRAKSIKPRGSGPREPVPKLVRTAAQPLQAILSAAEAHAGRRQ